MAGRIALVLTSTLLALGGLTGTAGAVADEAPTVGVPSITPSSAATVQVSVPVDSHGNDTTVVVEYVTAGAYRSTLRPTQRVPSAATTVTVGTTPASDAGPAVVTGQVSGLDPGSTYRMRVRAVNLRGEASSADSTVTMPAAPKITFKAGVGADTTKLTKLTVTRLTGGESATVRCKTVAKGCPFTSETVAGLAAGKHSLTSLLKGDALDPGTKVVIQVSAYGVRLSKLTLTIRDGQQPKVKRG